MTIEELARRIDEYSREVAPYEYMDEEFDGRDMIAETIEALETEPEHILKIFEEERDWREDSAGEYGKYLYEEASDLCDEIEKLIKKGSNMLVEIYPNNKSNRKYDEDYFSSIDYYSRGVEWYEDGDGLMVFLDTETLEEAVYRRYGGVLCLNDRSSIFLCVVTDDEGPRDEHNAAIQEMLIQEALDAGFPKETPKPKRTYLVDIEAFVRRTVEVEIEDGQDPTETAKKLLENERFYDEHIRGRWDVENVNDDSAEVWQVQEGVFGGYDHVNASDYL